MAVDQLNIIDVVGVDPVSGHVILTISDHLEWDAANKHLLVLQDKINAYLGMIEHGGLVQQYPDAKGRKVIIRVVMLHHPNEAATIFLDHVGEALTQASIGFEHVQKHFNSPP